KPPRAEETSTRIAKCKACSTIYKMTSDDLAFPFGVRLPVHLVDRKFTNRFVSWPGRPCHEAIVARASRPFFFFKQKTAYEIAKAKARKESLIEGADVEYTATVIQSLQ